MDKRKVKQLLMKSLFFYKTAELIYRYSHKRGLKIQTAGGGETPTICSRE